MPEELDLVFDVDEGRGFIQKFWETDVGRRGIIAAVRWCSTAPQVRAPLLVVHELKFCLERLTILDESLRVALFNEFKKSARFYWLYQITIILLLFHQIKNQSEFLVLGLPFGFKLLDEFLKFIDIVVARFVEDDEIVVR